MRIITVSREFGSGGREIGKRLADALSESLADWVRRTVRSDAVGCEAVVFEIKLPRPPQMAKDLAVVEKFRAAAASLEGVRTVELASQDNERGVIGYRVVYEKAKFPVGFVNALFTSHPELDGYLSEQNPKGE